MSIFTPFSILVISILSIHLFGAARDAWVGRMIDSEPESRDMLMKLAALCALLRIVSLFIGTAAFLHLSHEVFSYYGIA